MEDDRREFIKMMIARAMFVVSVAVFVTTLCVQFGDPRPLVPSLVPVFGIPFGIIYILAQIGYSHTFCKKGAYWLIGSIMIVVCLFSWINSLLQIYPSDFYLRAAIVGGSCLSGVFLAYHVLNGKV